MHSNKELLDGLKKLGDVIHLKSEEEAFVYYFSHLDISGIENLLIHERNYYDYPRSLFIKILKRTFDEYKIIDVEKFSINLNSINQKSCN